MPRALRADDPRGNAADAPRWLRERSRTRRSQLPLVLAEVDRARVRTHRSRRRQATHALLRRRSHAREARTSSRSSAEVEAVLWSELAAAERVPWPFALRAEAVERSDPDPRLEADPAKLRPQPQRMQSGARPLREVA